MLSIKPAENAVRPTKPESGTGLPAVGVVVTTVAVKQSHGLTKATRNPVDLARLAEPELPFDEAV
jgi:hypothetical protein